MAASSGDDVPTQLAALLGREVVHIRKTNETPPRISVIDVVEAITGQVKSNAGKTLERVKESHPDVYPNWINYRFLGRGQMDTPIADARGIVEIVMLLPGRHAAKVRRQAVAHGVLAFSALVRSLTSTCSTNTLCSQCSRPVLP